MRRLGQIIVNGLLLGLVACKAEEDHVIIDARLQVDRPLPDPVNIFERFDGRLDLDIQTIVFVSQVKLAAIGVITINDIDEGLTHIRQMVKHRLLDALRIAADDAKLAGVGIAPVLIKFMLLDELRRHEFVDEIHVVVDAAHFKDFFPTETQAFVPLFSFAEITGFFILLAEFPLIPAVFDITE